MKEVDFEYDERYEPPVFFNLLNYDLEIATTLGELEKIIDIIIFDTANAIDEKIKKEDRNFEIQAGFIINIKNGADSFVLCEKSEEYNIEKDAILSFKKKELLVFYQEIKDAEKELPKGL